MDMLVPSLFLIFATAYVVVRVVHIHLDQMEDRRRAENLRRMRFYREQGCNDYPHVLANGNTKWYRIKNGSVVL